MDGQRAVCIVTPGHLCTSPRVVKEADALQNAGFGVRVVSGRGPDERQRQDDSDIAGARKWRWDPVGWSNIHDGEKVRYWRAVFSHCVLRHLPKFSWSIPGIPERSEQKGFSDLATTAASEPNDLFIGHYPAGLAAAAKAADRWGAKFGFDAEDFHTADHDGSKEGRRLSALIAQIERRYLVQCSYVTASSPGIAAAYGQKYGIRPPVVIPNVFPLADRHSMDGKVKDRRGAPFSVYWFSQTIGPGRGIEYAIEACATLNGPFELHLRGTISLQYKTDLIQLAQANNVADHLFFYEQVAFVNVLARAAEHDVGLSILRPIVLHNMPGQPLPQSRPNRNVANILPGNDVDGPPRGCWEGSAAQPVPHVSRGRLNGRRRSICENSLHGINEDLAGRLPIPVLPRCIQCGFFMPLEQFRLFLQGSQETP